MTATVTASPGITDASDASPPPNWALVPFDVGCARCGHDLRGLTEPLCPACSLEFDWSEAVPIEELTCAHCGYHLYGLTTSRCPECGHAFDWTEALARYYRSRLPYFEYRWRDRPVKSLFGTWWRALRPKRFWRNMNLHDPPRPCPLAAMVGLWIILFFVVYIATVAVTQAFCELGYANINARPYGVRDFATTIVTRTADLLSTAFAWHMAIMYLTWLVTSFLALLVFQQSMRLGRVRHAQVMRVWAYSTPFISPVLAALTLPVYLAVQLTFGVWTATSMFTQYVFVAGVSGSLLAWVIWTLRVGYRNYLRMPHAFAVAVSSQIMASLATFAIVDIALSFGVSAEIVRFVGKWLGYW